jgi:cytochrome c
MKTTLLGLLATFLFASCGKEEKPAKEQINYEAEAKTPAQLGQELFEGSGNCFACHKPDQKIIAPSLQEIAKIYKTRNADMVKFLKGEGEPIVDPSQYEVMKTNFSITKGMTDEELKALETYISGFSTK